VAQQALYLKFRPQTFEDVIGQDHITRTLQNFIRQGRIRHAYLFSGPRGTGKTTNARLMAKALNCTDPDPMVRPCNMCENCVAINDGRFLDVIEIDAASHTGVDDVRDLRDKIAFLPNQGEYKVYIIDEVHRFSGAAFDALLKTLEEPPNHAIFILATTELDKVPATIKSRCMLFEFRRVSIREVMDRLANICRAEGISIDEGALELIARQGTGSVRDSESLLDQIVSDPDEHISFIKALEILGAAGNQYVWDVVQAIIENNTAAGLDVINTAIDSGADPRQFGQQVVDHLRDLLMVRVGTSDLIDGSDERRLQLEEQAEQIGRTALLKAIRAFNGAVNEIRAGWQPQLPLELAMVESTKPVVEEEVEVVKVVRPKAEKQPTPEEHIEATSEDGDEEDGVVSLVSLSQFLSGWESLKKTAYQINRRLPALLDWCQPYRVSGNTLVFGLTNPVFKPKLEKQITQDDLQRAVDHIYGSGLNIRFEVIDENTSQDQELAERISGDDFLARAVNELGAEIEYTDEGE
jgi:DNA polymerase-3 subunit gamma/tau